MVSRWTLAIGCGLAALGSLLAVSAGAEPPPPAPAPAPADAGPQTTEVTLEAPVSEVWKVFTTAEGWKMFGPAQADVDLRVGGKIRATYDPQGKLGDDGTIEQTILAYEPERMFAFRTTRAPARFPFPREALERTWNVATLQSLGGGRTRLSLRGHGYGTDEASVALRKFFETGNAQSLRMLEERFAGPKTARADAEAPIEVSVVVPASPDAVFRAWTTPEGIEGFLGVKARVVLEAGGPFELEFDPSKPAGERGSEGCTVLSWLPDRMLSFTWNAPPQFAHARAGRTVVVVELEAEAPGRTRVRLTHHGFHERAEAEPEHVPEWQAVRAYFAQAWPRLLEALRRAKW